MIVTNNTNSHLLVENVITHPQGRYLDKNQIDSVLRLKKGLVQPNQILNLAGVKGKSKSLDIDNIVAPDKKRNLMGGPQFSIFWST
jgi:hypothetical protein